MDEAMPELSILVVGDLQRREFREAAATLDRFGLVVRAADLTEARRLMRGGQVAPDLIVVAQAYPGQFTAEGLDRLRRLAPLARVIGLLGSWCEGELRTGDPWPAAIRVYWHQWRPGAVRQLAKLAAGSAGSWALPATASEEERLLRLWEEPPVPRQGRIGIWAADVEMHDWLQTACRCRGYQTDWLGPRRPEPPGPLTAVVFDAGDGNQAVVEHLRRWAARVRPAPLIALADFPRVEDRDRLRAAGAAAVLSKPLLVEDLFWELDQQTQVTGVAGIR